MPAFLTSSAIFSKVDTMRFSSSQLALYTTATLVFLGYEVHNFSTNSSIMDMLKNITMLAWCTASSSILSPLGMGVLPSIRVSITVCDTPGRVYSKLRVAAAARKELTPGTTLYFIPSLSSSLICSL